MSLEIIGVRQEKKNSLYLSFSASSRFLFPGCGKDRHHQSERPEGSSELENEDVENAAQLN